MKARSIALVSGKGGSGKTMIATAMGLQFGSSDRNRRIILIDADTATAGMSYYLGIKEVQNTLTGLSSLCFQPASYSGRSTTLLRPVQSYRSSSKSAGWLRFLPVGDHRKINREYQRTQPGSPDLTPLGQILKTTVQMFRPYADVLIVDCRGGIDNESLAVCEAVDDIILVVEPDTTSFQASRYLVDVLSEVGLADKLLGFIINKVYSNPEGLMRGGDFGTQFLAAIPFDIGASRSFLAGDTPSRSSIFSRHVEQALSRAYPAQILPPRGRIWGPRDYDRASVFAPVSSRGGIIIAMSLLAVGIAFSLDALHRALPRTEVLFIILALSIAGAASSALTPLRATIGKTLNWSVSVLRRVIPSRG